MTKPNQRLLTALWDATVALLDDRGYSVERWRHNLTVDGLTKGRTLFVRHLVQIAPGLDGASRCHVLLHELAHVILHENRPRLKEDQERRECEAETVACLVLAECGVDISGHSSYFGQAVSREIFAAARETVLQCAAVILDEIGPRLDAQLALAV